MTTPSVATWGIARVAVGKSSVQRITHTSHAVVMQVHPDWWSIAGTLASLLAVLLALWTVILSRRSLKEAHDQVLALGEQTDRLQQTLVKPALRVSRTHSAYNAINDVRSLPGWVERPDLFIAVTNIGLGRAVNIAVPLPAAGVKKLAILGDLRFLVSPEDHLIMGLILESPEAPGNLPIQIDYEDVVGNQYQYTCEVHYRASGVLLWTENERDEFVGSHNG